MAQHDHAHDEHHGHGAHHGHTHGVVDPSIASTDRGLWALKWSFVGLLATALFQVVVVVLSGSVALLADTIHNFGDAGRPRSRSASRSGWRAARPAVASPTGSAASRTSRGLPSS